MWFPLRMRGTRAPLYSPQVAGFHAGIHSQGDLSVYDALGPVELVSACVGESRLSTHFCTSVPTSMDASGQSAGLGGRPPEYMQVNNTNSLSIVISD
jgi:hypothetical protein